MRARTMPCATRERKSTGPPSASEPKLAIWPFTCAPTSTTSSGTSVPVAVIELTTSVRSTTAVRKRADGSLRDRNQLALASVPVVREGARDEKDGGTLHGTPLRTGRRVDGSAATPPHTGVRAACANDSRERLA